MTFAIVNYWFCAAFIAIPASILFLALMAMHRDHKQGIDHRNNRVYRAAALRRRAWCSDQILGRMEQNAKLRKPWRWS